MAGERRPVTHPAGERRVTLLSDFGTDDGYVAAMKGVIASLSPDTFLDDVAHELPRGDVRAAAWTLRRYWHLYPSGTVHLAVVDPGVGTSRRALAAEVSGRFFIAPDNGLLSWVFHDGGTGRTLAIDAERHGRMPLSGTFHGRDVFAPAAGRLAAGLPFVELGSAIEDPVRFTVPAPRRQSRGSRPVVEGEVVHADRFGNLISNIPMEWVDDPGAARVLVEGTSVGRIRNTYGDVEPQELLAVGGSDRKLEIAVRDGSAARRLGRGVGAAVRVELDGGSRASTS